MARRAALPGLAYIADGRFGIMELDADGHMSGPNAAADNWATRLKNWSRCSWSDMVSLPTIATSSSSPRQRSTNEAACANHEALGTRGWFLRQPQLPGGGALRRASNPPVTYFRGRSHPAQST